MTDQPVVTTLHPATTIPAKPISITLAWYFSNYKVSSITNTTWYKPGMLLSPEVVQKLCDLAGWTVIMADNELLQEITGAVIGAAAKSVTLPAL